MWIVQTLAQVADGPGDDSLDALRLQRTNVSFAPIQVPAATFVPRISPPGMKVKRDFMASRTKFAHLSSHSATVGITLRLFHFGEFHRLREHHKRRVKFLEHLRQPLRWIEHEIPQRTLSVTVDLVIQREDALNHCPTSANRASSSSTPSELEAS